MILSVSRRTDIPAYYSEWFINRLREGFVLVRNPMNFHQVSRISLSPEVVDCIVFWSKNPEPLLSHLDEISENYPFYFQYTVNAYGRDLEPNVPELDARLETLYKISEKYGSNRVVWRYDPVVLTDVYTPDWHIRRFRDIAERISAYTDTCVFSFVDMYDKVKANMKDSGFVPFRQSDMDIIAEGFSSVTENCGIALKTCSENVDLSKLKIGHSCCIDPVRISQITGFDLDVNKDQNQRPECGCVESIDIGQYNTCRHGCRYCYANYSQPSVIKNAADHDSASPLLIGSLKEDDKINDRKIKSLIKTQMSLF